jgi:hypothetical protein
MAQIYTTIRELNVMRWWHDQMEAIGIPFPSLVLRRYRRRMVDRRRRSRKKCRVRRRGDGSGRLRLLSKLEVIAPPSFCPRGSIDLIHHLPDGTGRIVGRFAWKTPVIFRKYSCDWDTQMLTLPCHFPGNPSRSSQERPPGGSQSRLRPTRSSSRRVIWASHRKHYTRRTWWPYAPTLASATNLVNLPPRFSNPTCWIVSLESSSLPIPLTRPLSTPARPSSRAVSLTPTGNSTCPPACYRVGSAPRNRFSGTTGDGSCM